jgi:hypothetical protein
VPTDEAAKALAEEYLAELPDAEFASLTARVRPPASADQLRTAAAAHIDGDQLEAFLKVANKTAFLNDQGDIDPAKVQQSIGGLFGISAPPGPAHQSFGQNTPHPPMPGPGDLGRAEAAKRFGGQAQPPARGRGGHEEAQRRFGKKEQ